MSIPPEINIKNPFDPNTTHTLHAIIIRTPNETTFSRGHYTVYIKIQKIWYFFDDLAKYATRLPEEAMKDEMKKIEHNIHSCIYVQK